DLRIFISVSRDKCRNEALCARQSTFAEFKLQLESEEFRNDYGCTSADIFVRIHEGLSKAITYIDIKWSSPNPENLSFSPLNKGLAEDDISVILQTHHCYPV